MYKIKLFVKGIFDKDRRVASGIIRIVMGFLNYWCISVFDRDYTRYVENADLSKYDPIGVLQLFFYNSPPSAEVLNGLITLGYVTSILMVLGVVSRLSTIIAILSGWALVSIQYSWGFLGAMATISII